MTNMTMGSRRLFLIWVGIGLGGILSLSNAGYAQSSLVSPSEPPKTEKNYFSDPRGRFYVDVTGWLVVPASESLDRNISYRYPAGDEVRLSIQNDANVVGNPFVDPVDRAETIRDRVAALHWTDARLFSQKTTKINGLYALEIVIVGNSSLRYKTRFVLIQHDGYIYQLCFTTLSSAYDWMLPPMNRVVESFQLGRLPTPLLGLEDR